MKKYLFLVVSMLLVGCGYQADNKKLIFSEGVSEELLKIYELKDGSIVYSQFLDIDYKDSKTEQIKFSKALKKTKLLLMKLFQKIVELTTLMMEVLFYIHLKIMNYQIPIFIF